MSSSWETSEDIDRDLYLYSDLPYSDDLFEHAPPKSIAEYKARTHGKKSGIFDDNTESVDIFISGRGKNHPGRIIRPGRPVEMIPEDDIILQKKIREVVGLGYRNEFIERAFRGGNSCHHFEDNSEESGVCMPNIKLMPAENSFREINKPSSPQTLDIPSDHGSIKSDDGSILGAKKKKKFTKITTAGCASGYSSTVRTIESNFKQRGKGDTLSDDFPPLE